MAIVDETPAGGEAGDSLPAAVAGDQRRLRRFGLQSPCDAVGAVAVTDDGDREARAFGARLAAGREREHCQRKGRKQPDHAKVSSPGCPG